MSFSRRWAKHRYQLRRGNHHNRHLQNAWNKDGEASFEFSILAVCPPKSCTCLEQKYLDEFRPFDRELGYNLGPIAGSSLGVKFSEDVRSEMSRAHRKENLSPETRARMSASAKRRMSSFLVREQFRLKAIGRVISAETRLKMSAAHKARYNKIAA